VVEPYGDSTRVPLFYKYFLGGVNSLRGFDYRSVGPHDRAPNGDLEPVGGETFYFASVDYDIPIIERLKFAIFYDIGNVYRNAYDYHLSEYSDDYGVGVRLNIPRLGPLRLDYGIPLHHVDNGGNGRFQFSVGFTRDY
jgi:outer membrane protein insertion porin family